MSLATDMDREYEQGEVDKIIVKATPVDWTEDTYKLIGENHLVETKFAQVVVDIYNACEKIRTK